MDPEADPDEDNENNIGNPVAGGDNNNGDVDQADTVFLVYNPQEHGNRPVMTWDTLLVGEGQNDIDGDEDIDGDLANFEPHTMRNRFEKLRDLIAGNLHFTYQSGKLKWPKQRSEIEDVYNEVARRLFPLGRRIVMCIDYILLINLHYYQIRYVLLQFLLPTTFCFPATVSAKTDG